MVPDPDKTTYIDEHGRKYWIATGYYGRSIKMYGEPWKLRTTLGEVIAQVVVLALAVLAICSAVFGK